VLTVNEILNKISLCLLRLSSTQASYFWSDSHVHHGRGITKHHFALYVGHLIDTLQDHAINDQDVNDLIGRINTYANEITGDVGSGG
jgi:hemoglobin